jgi:hypothetical protein
MTTVLRPTLTAFTLALILGAPSCARVRAPVEPREDPHAWPQINLADRDLQRRMAVRKPQVSQDQAGLLYVTVPVRNTTSKQYAIDYRAIFYDRNHEPIQETTWFTEQMTPHTQQTITVNTTSNRVDDFQIDIRPAK